MSADPHVSEELLLAECLGELDDAGHHRVSEHLRGCPLCRATLVRLRSEFAEIADAVEQDAFVPPARIEQAHADLMAKITPRRRFWGLSPLRWAAAGGVLSCALAAGIAWNRYSSIPVKVPESAPTVRAPAPAPQPVEPRSEDTVAPAPKTLHTPLAAEMLAAEVRIRYRLHQADICRRELVRIEKDSRGLVVKGTVASADMRSRIVASLAGGGFPSWVRTNLTTAEEASKRKRPVVASPSFADPQTHAVPQMRIALQDELDAYFRAHSPAQDITAFTNRAVALAEDALTEAWALRRLAERFGRERELDASEASILERMVRDHLHVLGEKNAETRNLTGPVLQSIAGGHALQGDGPAESEWAAACLQLFASVQRMHTGVMALFAVDLAATPRNKSRDVRAVLGSFQEIDAALDSLTLRTSRIGR